MPLLSPTAIRRAVTQDQRAKYAAITNWSKTLKLPASSFPARATPDDLKLYRQRCADDLYAWQKTRPLTKNSHPFVLHDGPPYANGPVHVGHALNKILKDLILRWEALRGKRVIYRPGWDCHGLPIELKALQQARAESKHNEGSGHSGKDLLSPSETRQRARQLALHTIDAQRESFRGWGVMGEWDTPYRTLDLDFELQQLNVFRDMVAKGLISRHHRPVYWSPSSRTALAEAELEYDDAHRCTAVFVKMPFAVLPSALSDHPNIEAGRMSALIWTTTPWTLPANKAVAVNEEIEYSVVELSAPGSTESDQILIAHDRLEHVLSFVPPDSDMKVLIPSITGHELTAGAPQCLNVFQGTQSPLLSASFVTATSGTGLVHMAPGHGMEDYQACLANAIDHAFAPVDDNGRFTSDALPPNSQYKGSLELTGLDAQTEGVDKILKVLSGRGLFQDERIWSHQSALLLASHAFTHKNPIDWRTKMPVIVRATAQWFADASAIKARALMALSDVTFIPETGKTRLSAFLEGRSQWCISRQRAWGVPIPALYHVDTNEACVSDESIQHIIEVAAERGTDAWFSDDEHEPAWLHPSLQPGKWVRGKDTMDVWFDSGSTWTTLPSRNGKLISDVCVEGTDQHRGWFQSSLLTAVAVQNSASNAYAPYRELITHGFTLDGEGRKMSKSLGNVLEPEQIIAGTLLPALRQKKRKGKAAVEAPALPQYDSLGPDVLRLWVASSDYTRDVSIAIPVLYEVQQALAKYRVTFRFLLGVLGDYTATPAEELSLLRNASVADRMVLHRLSECSRAVHHANGEYAFHRGIKDINTFVYNDLSAFYFEICKDRLYTGDADIRRRTQAVLCMILRELMQMLGAPVPHLVEEAWEHMPANLKDATHFKEHPLRQPYHGPFNLHSVVPGNNENMEQSLSHFKTLSDVVKAAQEEARRGGHLKSGLACRVVMDLDISDEQGGFHDTIRTLARDDDLAELLVVSRVDLGHDHQHTSPPAWRYEEFVRGSTGIEAGVSVCPPDMDKCIRCWRFVAEEKDVPCARCRGVMESIG